MRGVLINLIPEVSPMTFVPDLTGWFGGKAVGGLLPASSKI